MCLIIPGIIIKAVTYTFAARADLPESPFPYPPLAKSGSQQPSLPAFHCRLFTSGLFPLAFPQLFLLLLNDNRFDPSPALRESSLARLLTIKDDLNHDRVRIGCRMQK